MSRFQLILIGSMSMVCVIVVGAFFFGRSQATYKLSEPFDAFAKYCEEQGIKPKDLLHGIPEEVKTKLLQGDDLVGVDLRAESTVFVVPRWIAEKRVLGIVIQVEQ